MVDLQKLQARLGYAFSDAALLTTALTHSSYIFEQKEKNCECNERLEFLGDAVLELSISDALFTRFANLPEGKLTQRRAALVREETLAGIARTLELGTFMNMGNGEAQTGGRNKPSLLADVLEAIFGAVYLDGGFDAVREVINRLFEPFLNAPPAERDHKSTLQELLQKNSPETAVYNITNESGPPHKRIFTAEVRHMNKLLATGQGASKKQAEQAAAKAALGL